MLTGLSELCCVLQGRWWIRSHSSAEQRRGGRSRRGCAGAVAWRVGANGAELRQPNWASVLVDDGPDTGLAPRRMSQAAPLAGRGRCPQRVDQATAAPPAALSQV